MKPVPRDMHQRLSSRVFNVYIYRKKRKRYTHTKKIVYRGNGEKQTMDHQSLRTDHINVGEWIHSQLNL